MSEINIKIDDNDKKVWTIDVGSMLPDDAVQYVQNVLSLYVPIKNNELHIGCDMGSPDGDYSSVEEFVIPKRNK